MAAAERPAAARRQELPASESTSVKAQGGRAQECLEEAAAGRPTAAQQQELLAVESAGEKMPAAYFDKDLGKWVLPEVEVVKPGTWISAEVTITPGEPIKLEYELTARVMEDQFGKLVVELEAYDEVLGYKHKTWDRPRIHDLAKNFGHWKRLEMINVMTALPGGQCAVCGGASKGRRCVFRPEELDDFFYDLGDWNHGANPPRRQVGGWCVERPCGP